MVVSERGAFLVAFSIGRLSSTPMGQRGGIHMGERGCVHGEDVHRPPALPGPLFRAPHQQGQRGVLERGVLERVGGGGLLVLQVLLLSLAPQGSDLALQRRVVGPQALLLQVQALILLKGGRAGRREGKGGQRDRGGPSEQGLRSRDLE
jgi:hypothetical protein